MADRHTTEKLLEGERLSGKVTLFAKVTILPGDELPYHEHHGETEAYHILSGAGMYQDNDKTYPVQAGMTTFFCYCALETTAGLWASSYLTLTKGVAAGTAASFASLFYIGITAGRAACGFLTLKFNDTQMIRMGQCILAAGVLALLLPGPQVLALSGLVLVGLGCAPIYPSIIHSTPEHFGADRSQAVIGIQMASAYLGNLAMPPLFGLLANNITPALFPFYLLALLVLMVFMHEQLVRKTSRC